MLGNRLKEFREDRRLTQDQLSSLSGVTRQTISYIESNADYNPTLSTLLKLCNALNCSMEELFFTRTAQ